MSAGAGRGKRADASALTDFAGPQLAALGIVVATPAVFAILTWFNGSLLHFSIPVLAALYGLIACCLLGGFKLQLALRNARRSALAAAAGLGVSATLATLLVASHPADAAIHLGVTFVELVTGFCLWSLFSAGWALLRRPFLIALAIGILGQVIVGYCLMLSARHVPHFDWVGFRAGTSHVRQLGFYGTALCCLGAGLLATAKTRPSRIVFFILTTIGFAWNDLSGGRAAFGGGIGGVLLVWLLAPKERRKQLALLLAGAFLLAMPLSLVVVPSPYWGLKSILGRLFGFKTVQLFASGRLFLWIGALRGFLASPLIGHGEGQFIFEVGGRLWNHPHDSILQFLYQWGLIGTTCVLIMVGPIVTDIRRAARSAPDVALPAGGALVGLLLMSLLEGSLYHVFPVAVVAICLAILASTDGQSEPAGETRR